MNLEELILDVLVGFDINIPTPELKIISAHLVDTVEDWMEAEGYSISPDNGDPVSTDIDVQVDNLDSEKT